MSIINDEHLIYSVRIFRIGHSFGLETQWLLIKKNYSIEMNENSSFSTSINSLANWFRWVKFKSLENDRDVSLLPFFILVGNYDLFYVLEKKLHDFEYFLFLLSIKMNDSVTDMKLSLNIQSFSISKVHLIASLRDKHPHSVSIPSNHPTIQSPDKCV